MNSRGGSQFEKAPLLWNRSFEKSGLCKHIQLLFSELFPNLQLLSHSGPGVLSIVQMVSSRVGREKLTSQMSRTPTQGCRLPI